MVFVSDTGGADGPGHEGLILYPMVSPLFIHSAFTDHTDQLLIQVLGTQQ